MNRNGLSRLVGLTREKARASIDIAACSRRREVFPHTLLYGVGGTGKTSLARAIACELGYYFVEKEAAALRGRKLITEVLLAADQAAYQHHHPLLIFVDEVHRLTENEQEVFYFPMKEWRIDTTEGWVKLRPFTFIAATTRRDMLDEASFVARFPNQWEVKRYHHLHIEEILADIFRGESISFGPSEVAAVAKRCLGIPRSAHNLARKIRNQVLARGGHRILPQDVDRAFYLEGIDCIGLTETHVSYLKALHKAHRPRGLKMMSSKLQLSSEVVEGRIEPILISLGFIDQTPSGRILTDAGQAHLQQAKHI